MRVTTAFNRLLAPARRVGHRRRLQRRGGDRDGPAAASAAGLLGLRADRPQLQIHDRRVKRWRHLDLGASRCWIECELRRLRCPDCGVRLEAVPWARPGVAHTRDFEDVVAWLAQQMAFDADHPAAADRVAHVGPIVERVVADHLDERRLEGLVAIGVDEISYRRHQRYLTSVVDHASGRDRVVLGRPQLPRPCRRFFDELGDRRHSIQAVSIDMSGGYEKAIRDSHPATPRSPLTPSTSSGSPAARPTRSAATNGTPTTARTPRHGRWVKSTRWSLLEGARATRASASSPALHEVSQANRAPLPRLPAERGTAAALPPARPRARTGAPRRLAGMGLTLAAAPVRPARAHHPPPPRRHPRRDPPRPLQRPP